MASECDLIIANANIATFDPTDEQYGQRYKQVVAVQKGKIVFVGQANDCPYQSHNHINAQGQWLLPGFIDCHTHLVHGGNRSHEFEQRQNGVSYAQIAQQGGGIKSTVASTRKISEQSLHKTAISRAAQLLSEGVTTIEIKSGYGLDIETELKMLRVARSLQTTLGVNVRTTYLGAHATPAEFNGDNNAYIDFVCNQALPQVAASGLADAVDVFCESIGFTPQQCEQVFQSAQKHKLAIKAHVEQLSDLKGALLGAKYDAMSVDHLEYLSAADVPQLAKTNTVAVILPGAFYYLRETQKPPIAALRKHKVPMAVATDLNPGSSPIASLLTAANMSCVLFSMTPLEALQGITCHAAKALRLHTKGVIKQGNDADFNLWPIEHPNELVYSINNHKPNNTWIDGKHVSAK